MLYSKEDKRWSSQFHSRSYSTSSSDELWDVQLFLNQLIWLKPEIKQVKAIGTDGELALCNDLRDSILQAIHLRCFKHIKDGIERKLHDLEFDKETVNIIVADIFEVICDGMQELGFGDAKDPDEFFGKLMSLEKSGISLKMNIVTSLLVKIRNPCFTKIIAPFFLKVLFRRRSKSCTLSQKCRTWFSSCPFITNMLIARKAASPSL